MATKLKCTEPGCNNVSDDISKDPNAWDGWQIVPRKNCVCPQCITNAVMQQNIVVEENHFRGRVIRTLHLVGEES